MYIEGIVYFYGFSSTATFLKKIVVQYFLYLKKIDPHAFKWYFHSAVILGLHSVSTVIWKVNEVQVQKNKLLCKYKPFWWWNKFRCRVVSSKPSQTVHMPSPLAIPMWRGQWKIYSSEIFISGLDFMQVLPQTWNSIK